MTRLFNYPRMIFLALFKNSCKGYPESKTNVWFMYLITSSKKLKINLTLYLAIALTLVQDFHSAKYTAYPRTTHAIF